jgi:hypothetical protein
MKDLTRVAVEFIGFWLWCAVIAAYLVFFEVGGPLP